MKPSDQPAADQERERIEFVLKRELDRARQKREQLRKQNERLQKENHRLRQEAERLPRELEAELRASRRHPILKAHHGIAGDLISGLKRGSTASGHRGHGHDGDQRQSRGCLRIPHPPADPLYPQPGSSGARSSSSPTPGVSPTIHDFP
jgi:hypothetical protein